VPPHNVHTRWRRGKGEGWTEGVCEKDGIKGEKTGSFAATIILKLGSPIF